MSSPGDSPGQPLPASGSGRPGRVVVISGPSGSGKSTVLGRILKQCPSPLAFSVSATTRKPRPGEQDGVHYHFLSNEEFARRRAAEEFLECFEVYGRGCWYGTLLSEVTTGLRQGKWVVLEIDVQGARAVRERFPRAVTIFLEPGDEAELARRLRARGTESEAEIERRLNAARAELAAADWYDHRVLNDSPGRAAAEICRILSDLDS